ncbi:MAG: hypothetical protein IJ058_12315 [Lachnospiraceae bacterium]|nr:hypothetical protein [Lachnospiraceae bacterium]
MQTWQIVVLIILLVMIAGLAVLYFLGKKAQKKQAEQQEQLDAMKQTVSMLVIDKKRMKLRDAGLPQMVLDQTPKYLQGSKLPIVKAKVGPQIMSFIADEKIFDDIPVKREVKATVSGLYISSVRGLHGNNNKPSEPVKKNWRAKLQDKIDKLQEKAGAKPIK